MRSLLRAELPEMAAEQSVWDWQPDSYRPVSLFARNILRRGEILTITRWFYQSRSLRTLLEPSIKSSDGQDEPKYAAAQGDTADANHRSPYGHALRGDLAKAAARYVYAGRGDDAVAVLAPRMPTIGKASPRAYAIHGARLAHGYALAGAPTEACQTIGEVLDAIDLTQSATARAELRAAAAVLVGRWPQRSDVTDMVNRIRQAT
jgi:hypothetical protein